MNDAEERFLEAARAFQAADELARSREPEVDDKVFKRIIIDLDAAMPGLEGLFLGRALLLRAHTLWWLYWLGMQRKATGRAFFDPSAPRDPLLAESHKFALQGKKILMKMKADKTDLRYADDLVAKSE